MLLFDDEGFCQDNSITVICGLILLIIHFFFLLRNRSIEKTLHFLKSQAQKNNLEMTLSMETITMLAAAAHTPQFMFFIS